MMVDGHSVRRFCRRQTVVFIVEEEKTDDYKAGKRRK